MVLKIKVRIIIRQELVFFQKVDKVYKSRIICVSIYHSFLVTYAFILLVKEQEGKIDFLK